MNCDLTLHNISGLCDSTGVSYTKFLQLSECPTCSTHPVQPTEVHECVRGCLGLSDLHFIITWTQIVWMLACPSMSCECADAALQGHQVQTGKQSNENNYLSVCMSTSEYNTSMMITCWQKRNFRFTVQTTVLRGSSTNPERPADPELPQLSLGMLMHFIWAEKQRPQ